jgi:hypothetical protein
MKQDNTSSKPPATSQSPDDTDPLVRIMRRHGIPVTRENYLDLAYMGQPPEELGPEEESELPEELQRRSEGEPRRRSNYTSRLRAGIRSRCTKKRKVV